MSDASNGHGIVRMALNVPAVARLIAGDQTLELFLRQQVKAQVFDNAIAQIMSADSVKKLVDEFKTKVETTFRTEVAKQIGEVRSGYSQNYKETLCLNPDFKRMLDATISSLVEPLVAKLVKDRVQQVIEMYQLLSDEKLAKLLNDNIEKRINDGINQRIAAAAKGLGL